MFTGKLIKKDGRLTYEDERSKLAYQIFMDKLPEGQLVEIYIDLADVDHSKAQLAKVHACIRELAIELGYTFDEMKNLIKMKSGIGEKSFALCSKNELMLSIEACISIGKEVNINLG
jgi:hypothetical protein